MSELLQILQKYKNSKIALYGLGIETEKVLNKFDSQFDFVGLLDGYRKDGFMYGKRIISFQEAVESEVKLILVVARPGSCRAIAKKIRESCICNQIDLVDVRGRDLSLDCTVCYDLDKIQGITKYQLVEMIDGCSVLSVDLFDTLIMRNTLFYTDIFDIVAFRLKGMGIGIEGFSQKRIAAEKFLATAGAPSLNNIYAYMIEKYGLQGVSVNYLVQLEWEIDLSLIVPRQEICDLIARQYQAGKMIYIVSDSYYSKIQIEKMLQKCGIDFYTDIFISCEYHMGKAQGLFEKLKQKLDRRSCLHIGDDMAVDVEAAMDSGLNACRIYSGIDLLEATGYLGMWDHITKLSDRIKIGIFTAKLFNSPFQFESGIKKIGIEDAFDVGYLLFAPMITDFVLWFREQVERFGLKNIWFCARDGYLIKMLYDKLSEDNVSIYFLTSRTAAVRAGVENDDDIRYVGSMKFAGSLEVQLAERFGITLERESRGKEEEEKQLLDYKDIILKSASANRHNYQNYIRSLEIDDGDIAFFDFVAKGTSQLFVQRFIPNHFKGLYFLQLEKENMEGLDIIPFYSTQELESSAIYENYYILETVLTSDQPSVIGFDNKGSAIYAKEFRSKEDLKCFKMVQEGIYHYFQTYLELCPEGERCENKKLNEVILELIHGIEIRDDIFRGMMVEDQFFNRITEIDDLL